MVTVNVAKNFILHSDKRSLCRADRACKLTGTINVGGELRNIKAVNCTATAFSMTLDTSFTYFQVLPGFVRKFTKRRCVIYLARDGLRGGSRGRVQGVRTPPP